jgi:hypothetical protein
MSTANNTTQVNLSRLCAVLRRGGKRRPTNPSARCSGGSSLPPLRQRSDLQQAASSATAGSVRTLGDYGRSCGRFTLDGSPVLDWQSQCHRAQRAQVITTTTRQEASGREHQLALGGLPGSSFYLRRRHDMRGSTPHSDCLWITAAVPRERVVLFEFSETLARTSTFPSPTKGSGP